MPDLVEQMYCSQQIHIPPTFPFILKQYCKAAIRTQPYDLLRWSAAYFRCLAKGEPPPVKPRLEFPATEYPTGLTAGYLKILLIQFAGKDFVDTEELYKKWRGICLPDQALAEILMLGGFDMEVDIQKFVAICAGYLCDILSRTMILICELLTEEPEGGSSMIPCDVFINLFTFLARLNCGPTLDEDITQLPEGFFSHVLLSPTQSETSKDLTVSSSESEESEKKTGLGLESSLKDALWDALLARLPECSDSDSTKEAQMQLDQDRMETATSSDPQLGKCISLEEIKSVESMIKKAIWGSVTEKLDYPEMHPDEIQILKEQLWQTVLRKIAQYKDDDSDIQSFLYSLILEIPALKARIDRGSEMEKSPSQILKDAIWAAITEKKPPEQMKGTVWGTLNRYDDLSPDDIKDVIWEAVLGKIPSGQYPYAPYEGEGDEALVKCEPRRVPSELIPNWVGRPIPVYRVEVKGIGPVLPEEQIEAVCDFVRACCEYQEGMVMPRNIRHFLCPPLDPPGIGDDVDDILNAEEKPKEDEEKDSKSGSADIDMGTYEMNALKDIECYTKPY